MTTLPSAALPAPRAAASVWLVRVVYTLSMLAVICTATLGAGAAFYTLSFRGRIFPGVRAWGVDLSGLKPEEAALALTEVFTYPNNPAFILSDGQVQRTPRPSELGLSFDVGATVLQAYQVGRSGNLLADWAAEYQAWHAGVQIAPVLTLDEGRLRAYLNDLAAATYRPTVEAALQTTGTDVQATPGQVGRQLDVEQMAAALQSHLLRLEKAALPLAFTEAAPAVLDASAQAQVARTLLSRPLTLTLAAPGAGDPGPWTLDPPTLATMLRITRVSAGNGAARFDVALDADALRAFLQPLAEPLRRAPQNARFTFNDDTHQIELLQSGQAARELDVDGSVAAINAALLKGQAAVPLVFTITPPPVADNATAAQLGLTELVSQQSTYFVGSSAERMKNIQTAAARFHGLLVPPNSVFSFDDALGDVSLDNGFAEALIIYGGRTIRGVGGGVCQVSTTLFRAAYFGGFPIVERNAHAYRVGYYERGDTWKGPGLDATVYAPLVDFKFKNDTPYWLLMETYFNPAAARLTWKFYSTSDGRQVTVSAPRVENEVPAPDPQYEENADLKAGEIKQVDYAAIGADVTVTRVITRGGAQVNAGEPPIRTHYQPWRAIFQYGPGTPDIPTPAPPATP